MAKNTVVPIRGYLEGVKKITFRSSPIHRRTDDEKFIVGGAYARLLRLSRWLGLAPLRFTPCGSDYLVTISKPCQIYGCILITIWLLSSAFTSILNLIKSQFSKTIFVHISVLCFNIHYVIVGITVYGAVHRFRKLFKCMDAIALVDQSIDAQYSEANERRFWRNLVSVVLSFILVIVFDIFVTFRYGQYFNANFLRIFGNIIICLGFMLELQFAVLALSVSARFKAINKILNLVDKNLSVPYVPSAVVLPVLNIFSKRVAPVEPKTVVVRKSENGDHYLVVPISEAVQRISILYGMLCDVVNDVNDSYSMIVISTLISSLTNLVGGPFLLIEDFQTSKLDMLTLIESMWTFIQIPILLMMMEPCQHTNHECIKIESTVSRMISACPSRGGLPARLKVFSRQLTLRRIGFRPMGIFTLNRSLIASVIGLVTTYLVIMLQFRISHSE